MSYELVRYGEAFKKQVVAEVRSGAVSQTGAARKYGVGGKMTIRKWLRKYGVGEMVAQVVTIDMENRRDKVSELEREKRQLESALAQAQLKVMALEALIDVAEAKYHIPIKKNSGGRRSSCSGSETSDPASGKRADSSNEADKGSTNDAF